MIKQYETIVILTPILSDSDAQRQMKKYVSLIKEKGGEIVTEEFWGLKHLAYSIEKKTSGIYFLVEFKSEGALIDALELQYRRDPEILRFLTVTLDKHAIKYNDEKRRGLISRYKVERLAKEAAAEKTKVAVNDLDGFDSDND